MTYHWKYIENPHSDFPEIYFLRNSGGDRIRVEANRRTGMVKIKIEGSQDTLIEAAIRNGSLLRELDVKENKPRSLEKEIAPLAIDISSLPDSGILRLIGGNYGILTEFLGSVEKKEIIGPQSKLFLQKLYSYFSWIAKIPQRIYRFFKEGVLQKPKLSDVIELFTVLSLIAGIYSVNFNALQAGFIGLCAAFVGMFTDIFFRRNDVLLSKFLISTWVSLYGVAFGLYYQ